MTVVVQIFFTLALIFVGGVAGYCAVSELRRRRPRSAALKSSLPIGRDMTMWGLWAIIMIFIMSSNVRFIEPSYLKIMLLSGLPAAIVVVAMLIRFARHRAVHL